MDRNQLLFGKIAEELGYVTEAQLEECLEQQRTHPDVALGQLMLERKHVSPEQLEDILSIQKERFHERDPHTYEKLEDILFGRLLVREGLVTERQVREALRDQAATTKPEEFKYLGELLVERGLMKPEDVARVLKLQQRSIVYCEECLVQYNVAQFEENSDWKCKKCGGILTAPPILSSVSVEGFLEDEEAGGKNPG